MFRVLLACNTASSITCIQLSTVHFSNDVEVSLSLATALVITYILPPSFQCPCRQIAGIVLVIVAQTNALQSDLTEEDILFARCSAALPGNSSMVAVPPKNMTYSALMVAGLAAATVTVFVLAFRSPYRRVAAESGLRVEGPLQKHY